MSVMEAPMPAAGAAGPDVETGISRFLFVLPDGESGESRLHIRTADDQDLRG